MPKILVNYKYDKKTDKFKILDYDHIFADMPIAVMEMDKEYDEVLVVPVRGTPTVFEKEEFLEKHKKFYFIIEGEDVKECTEKDEYNLTVYLPKDTDVEKLKYINNQLYLIDDSKEEKGDE